MIRLFVYTLILILSAYAAAAAQDSPLAATSPTPNPSSTEKITFTEVNVDGPYIAMTFDDGPARDQHSQAAGDGSGEAHQTHLLCSRRMRRAEPGRSPPGGRGRT